MNFVEFCKMFQEQLFLKKANVFEKYKSTSEYTKLIEEIMRNIGTQSSGDRYDPEFFKIDHTWWNTKPNEEKNGVNIYDWNLNMVVEHENNWRDWTYEVEKLDSIIAPLRIVIGYMDNSLRIIGVDGMSEEERILEEQRKRMKNLNILPKEYEFGVILMNRTLVDDENPWDMRGYMLSGGTTEKMF